MNKTKLSGPVFPTEVWGADGLPRQADGMYLRDYFAAKAMQGMQARYYDMFLNGTFEDWNIEGVPAMAIDAYEIADAMLKAREA